MNALIGASLASRLLSLDALTRNDKQTNEITSRLEIPTRLEALTAEAQASSDLSTEGRLSNFEIQRLMSAFNQAEQLSSNVQKKQDDANSGLINKIV